MQEPERGSAGSEHRPDSSTSEASLPQAGIARNVSCDQCIGPAAAGAHAGLRGPFTQLSFPKFKPAVWLQHENSSAILEKPETVEGYAEIIESLNAASLSADESTATIRKVMFTNEER